MKKYLLDTHVLLWWLTDDPKLSKSAKDLLSNSKNIIFTSVVSAWEMHIKLTTNNKFKMVANIKDCFSKELGFKTLPIKLEHTYELKNLEKLHKDPFNRMLISQAKVEDLILISADEKIKMYSGVEVLW